MDWVWVDQFAHDPSAKRSVGINPADGLTEFKEHLTTQCPELALCQDIANGFKHMKASKPHERSASGAAKTGVDTKIIVPGGNITMGVESGSLEGNAGAVTGTTTHDPYILDDLGNRRRAVDVFTSARDFWERFIDDYGID
jgi:hypothetical protein